MKTDILSVYTSVYLLLTKHAFNSFLRFFLFTDVQAIAEPPRSELPIFRGFVVRVDSGASGHLHGGVVSNHGQRLCRQNALHGSGQTQFQRIRRQTRFVKKASELQNERTISNEGGKGKLGLVLLLK